MEAFPSSIQVSESSTREYEDNLDALISAVDKRMTMRLDEMDLIGPNSLSVMYNNHENHGNLMVNVLKFNDFSLLENILPWVISNYTSKGFTFQYFLEALDQWEKAIAQHLSPQASAEIIPVYEWMEEVLPAVRDELSSGALELRDVSEVMMSSRSSEINFFVELLIKGRHNEAHQFMKNRISGKESLQEIYNDLIRPAMYEIGRLWEKNKITVAHEHLATSIIMRMITFFYMDYVSTESSKGKAVVTAAANEYHEIGARIVADFLEIDGWDVSYLGANTPTNDLINMLEDTNADMLCISITMIFNFEKVRRLIEKIRNIPNLSSLKIMVGGYAFMYSSSISDKIGADAVALTAGESIKVAELWWREMANA